MEDWEDRRKDGIVEYWNNACPVKCDAGAISTGEWWKIGKRRRGGWTRRR